uniref:DUF1232 domain-containing protein n=1 Tax=Oryza sativa subsp. japonica TaxID=39947 RepID=Q6YZS5_ORYSJ|nr:hypothetical protein [Oryza sativa Japonica Group]BAD03725.1 hypothetical protein [Oryza sativa Japonica Group]
MHAASLFFFLTRAGRCLVSSSPPMLDGEERMRVAGDGATWRCSLFYALADGGCLASYVVLLPNKAPHWLPAVGMVDDCIAPSLIVYSVPLAGMHRRWVEQLLRILTFDSMHGRRR